MKHECSCQFKSGPPSMAGMRGHPRAWMGDRPPGWMAGHDFRMAGHPLIPKIPILNLRLIGSSERAQMRCDRLVPFFKKQKTGTAARFLDGLLHELVALRDQQSGASHRSRGGTTFKRESRTRSREETP